MQRLIALAPLWQHGQTPRGDSAWCHQGRAFSTSLQDEQLLLEGQGLRGDRMHAAWPCELDQCHEQVGDENEQLLSLPATLPARRLPARLPAEWRLWHYW
jgi:hypothetical protein